jgi:hypothetical protein
MGVQCDTGSRTHDLDWSFLVMIEKRFPAVGSFLAMLPCFWRGLLHLSVRLTVSPKIP